MSLLLILSRLSLFIFIFPSPLFIDMHLVIKRWIQKKKGRFFFFFFEEEEEERDAHILKISALKILDP